MTITHPSLTVPWDRADDLHAKLRLRGYPATLCLDPEARAARLELWPGVPPEPATAALTELLAVRTASWAPAGLPPRLRA